MSAEPRFTARLKSQHLLRDAMTLQGIKSAYELAKRAGLGVGIVGHLVAGRRDSCNPHTASAIEEALRVPHGWLFVAEMSPVNDDTRPRKGAAA